MFDTIVVSVAVLAAIGFLVFRLTRKGGGCASCPPGCGCAVKDARKEVDVTSKK